MIEGGYCESTMVVTMIQMWTYACKCLVMYMEVMHGLELLKAYSDFLVKCTRVPKNVQILGKKFNDCRSLETIWKELGRAHNII